MLVICRVSMSKDLSIAGGRDWKTSLQSLRDWSTTVKSNDSGCHQWPGCLWTWLSDPLFDYILRLSNIL